MATGQKTVDSLGKLGLPAPLAELRQTRWDVIVVGAGHNGLTCAAYLARAGKKVLVVEARDRVGGACTLEEMWPGFMVSPCAYLSGLLHPLVIDELNMAAYGYEWIPAAAGLFVPFEDGSAIQLWEDEARCAAEVARLAPRDLAGWRAMGDVMHRAREALRPAGDGDLWIGDPPTRAQIEARIGSDSEVRGLLFDWSMVEYVERYLTDERLQIAYLGQGVIGTNASPFAAGTASVNFHHSSGRLGGMPGMWGYVKGGMGLVSFILCDIARDAGVSVATGLPVAEIRPGEGVVLDGGDLLRAPLIVSNADPRVTLRLLGNAAPPAWRDQIQAVPIEGCTVKVTLALDELPNFRARPGSDEPHHRGQVNTPLSKAEWQSGFETARAGGLPPRLWTELYFQTAADPSVAPAGKQMMSVFAQYVPYAFAEGSWETRRQEVAQVAINSIARYVSNFPAAIIDYDIKGPPDIEREIGLTGGHIFQGSILPEHMWERRLTARTPLPGVYLCGAGTYPGGSVIAINGRNAAMALLADQRP